MGSDSCPSTSQPTWVPAGETIPCPIMAPRPHPRRSTSVRAFLLGNRLNALVVFLPIALVLRGAGASDILVFLTSALAVVPLAGLIGATTEEVARYVGPGLGGFLNATFGNAAEL